MGNLMFISSQHISRTITTRRFPIHLGYPHIIPIFFGFNLKISKENSLHFFWAFSFSYSILLDFLMNAIGNRGDSCRPHLRSKASAESPAAPEGRPGDPPGTMGPWGEPWGEPMGQRNPGPPIWDGWNMLKHVETPTKSWDKIIHRWKNWGFGFRWPIHSIMVERRSSTKNQSKW